MRDMSRFGAALAADPDPARAARRAAHAAFGRVAGAPDLVVVTAALADPDAAQVVAAAVAELVAMTGNDRCAIVGTMAQIVMGETSLGDADPSGRGDAAAPARQTDAALREQTDDDALAGLHDAAATGVGDAGPPSELTGIGAPEPPSAASPEPPSAASPEPPSAASPEPPYATSPGLSSVAVWAARLPGARVRAFRLHSHRVARPFEGPSVGDHHPNGGMAVGGLPEPWPDERVALLFADPYSFPVDGFLARCNTVLPDLPFVGGLAPGPDGYGSARLLLGSTAYATGAVGVLIGGDVRAAIAVSQGCRAIGPAMTVTAADGDVLLGLAGRPAYQRLREILDELPGDVREQASTTGLHLGIALDEYAEHHDSGDFLIRGVVGVLPELDAIRVGAHVEVGQTVRFQVRDAASAAEQLRVVLRDARRRPGYETIGGALLVSCHGRAAGLFPAPFGASHDLNTVRSELGTGAVAGFFGTGEIGPVGGRNHLHGYTASVLAFAEGE
jgi:small ligand-binding sensory domain FIST